MGEQPFTHSPAATQAFACLNDDLANHPHTQDPDHFKGVVIGGGTGAPVSIRTLLSLDADTSAVVAMADDGGSTGILREEAGVLPPGDIRKCLAAMAQDDNDPLTRAFKYRFTFARNHTLGNLMISALEDATGSFPEAISICGKLLGAKGNVYPSTLDKVQLCGRTLDGEHIVGQASVGHSHTALSQVWLESDHEIRAYEPALEAIRNADIIILGPGSLFTSIIPNLLVPGVIESIRESRGKTLFVCSLADMQGETWGLSALEHYQALLRHGMDGLIDYMLVHSPEDIVPGKRFDRMIQAVHADVAVVTEMPRPVSMQCGNAQVRSVRLNYEDVQAIQSQGTVVLVRDLVDPVRPTWHDPAALRGAISTVVRLSKSHR